MNRISEIIIEKITGTAPVSQSILDDRRARRNLAKRKWRAKRSPAQRAKDNLYKRNWSAQRSPEQKARDSQVKSMWWSNLPPEKKVGKKYCDLSPEEKKKRSAATMKSRKKKRAGMTPEEERAYLDNRKLSYAKSLGKKTSRRTPKEASPRKAQPKVFPVTMPSGDIIMVPATITPGARSRYAKMREQYQEIKEFEAMMSMLDQTL